MSIVRENIDRLFLGTPDLGRDHAEPLPVQVIVHADAIVTDGFGTLVRALARFCQVEVAILGEHPDTDLPALFGDAQLFLSSGELIELALSTNVLLVSGSDQEAMRLAAQAWAQSGTPFIVADTEILATDDRVTQAQAIWRERIWDDRVFRPATRRTPAADLVLLLDDYGLSG